MYSPLLLTDANTYSRSLVLEAEEGEGGNSTMKALKTAWDLIVKFFGKAMTKIGNFLSGMGTGMQKGNAGAIAGALVVAAVALFSPIRNVLKRLISGGVGAVAATVQEDNIQEAQDDGTGGARLSKVLFNMMKKTVLLVALIFSFGFLTITILALINKRASKESEIGSWNSALDGWISEMIASEKDPKVSAKLSSVKDAMKTVYNGGFLDKFVSAFNSKKEELETKTGLLQKKKTAMPKPVDNASGEEKAGAEKPEDTKQVFGNFIKNMATKALEWIRVAVVAITAYFYAAWTAGRAVIAKKETIGESLALPFVLMAIKFNKPGILAPIKKYVPSIEEVYRRLAGEGFTGGAGI
jgi:hypothetical protein